MHLSKAVVLLAFATGGLAAVAAVPIGGDSAVIERPDISPRSVADALPAADLVTQEQLSDSESKLANLFTTRYA